MAKKNIPLQPENFELEANTVWAFPDRGNGQRTTLNIAEIGRRIFRETSFCDTRKRTTLFWISSSVVALLPLKQN